jgi:hypothetical protein
MMMQKQTTVRCWLCWVALATAGALTMIASGVPV